MNNWKFIVVSLVILMLVAAPGVTAEKSSAAKASATARVGQESATWAGDQADLSVVHRIKAEAFENSKVMDHLFQLTDVNGPRVTNSPGHRQAVKWSMKRLEEYGLENVKAEEFEFGKGWSFSRFSAHLIEPAYAPLTGFPMAWTPGTDGVVTAEPIHAVLKEEKDLEKFKGKLQGKLVLMDKPRDVKLSDIPIGKRFSEEDLEARAQAEQPRSRERRDRQAARKKRMAFSKKLYQFLTDEGAVGVIRISYKGEAGLVAASRAGSQDAEMPVPPPTFALSAEHYNRLIRLLKKEVPVKVEFEIAAQFHEDDLNTQNVLAEIPGGAKEDEVVMLGGHLDSWHGGTGAADNAAGVAITIEAVRILKALGLRMDRTVRIALWSGEEQGLLGSKAYVKEHFADPETMEPKPEHEKLAGYFNYDNGGGKIRGIYLQGNDMCRPAFDAWMRPFHDLDATTVTIRNTGGTDHQSFDAVGLPGFQFIQDPLEYSPRTHHSNADVYDHINESDLMQSAAIMASFVYHAAMRDRMLPRKPLPKAKPKEDDKKKSNEKES